MLASLVRGGAKRLATAGAAVAWRSSGGYNAHRALAAKANTPVPLAKISDNFLDATSMNFLEV